MARPPIIISNSGICDKLAKNCANQSEDQVSAQIKQNVKNLQNSKVMIIKKADKHTPCVYWRLNGDKEFENKVIDDPDYPDITQGEESISINDMIDDF